jgi:hypothetical protein
MAKIIRSSRTRVKHFFTRFGRGPRAPLSYRWYEVEVACF